MHSSDNFTPISRPYDRSLSLYHSDNMDTSLTGRCYLLERLPPELRLRIYDFVFYDLSCSDGRKYNMVQCWRAYKDGRLLFGGYPRGCIRWTPSKDLTLLGTCKQIYHEALPFLRDQLKFLVCIDGDWKECNLDNGSWTRWCLSTFMKHVKLGIQPGLGSPVDSYLADIKDLGSMFQQHGRRPVLTLWLRDSKPSDEIQWSHWTEQLVEGLKALARDPSAGDIETALYAGIANQVKNIANPGRMLTQLLRRRRT
jgi:hypothetical protein